MKLVYSFPCLSDLSPIKEFFSELRTYVKCMKQVRIVLTEHSKHGQSRRNGNGGSTNTGDMCAHSIVYHLGIKALRG